MSADIGTDLLCEELTRRRHATQYICKVTLLYLQGDIASGVSALLAWFPATWASKVAPCFIGDAGVTIQCPTRKAANTAR